MNRFDMEEIENMMRRLAKAETQKQMTQIQEQSPKASKERFTSCQVCEFVVKGNGSRYCIKCGVIEDFSDDWDTSDLPTKQYFRRQAPIDPEVHQLLQRFNLSQQVQQLQQQNSEKVQNSGIILHHANLAIQEVNKYRTQFKIKGNTPLKLVALIVINQTANTCITKEEVLKFFGFEGKNLTHTQQMLNEYRQQFILYKCENLIAKDVMSDISELKVEGGKQDDSLSDLGNFIMSSSNKFQFTRNEIELGDRIYEVLDKHKVWLNHTENVRFRIAACLLLTLCANLRHQCKCEKKKANENVCKKCFATLYFPLSGQSKPQDATKQFKKYQATWSRAEVIADLISLDPNFATLKLSALA